MTACRKDDKLSAVDMNKYPADSYVPTSIDQWIGDNLTNPYNIQVVYRFERNLADPAKDIAPPDMNKVKPMMGTMLNCFLKPYETIAGSTFIKTLTPKQFVLYGSNAYQTNGSLLAGTADGGRRVVLYNVNGLDVNNQANVRGRIGTIHHEFTHILNQNIAIPANFEEVTNADYNEDWNATLNSAALAKSLGFITRYSRMNKGEDFAEMVSFLLVDGQVAFNNYITTATPDARAKLRAKELIVRDYFKTYMNIDFSVLQAEVQKTMLASYNITPAADLTTTSFPIMLMANKVDNITYDTTATHYTTYGQSAAFKTVYTSFRTDLRKERPTYDVNYFRILFTSDTTMSFRVAYNTGTASVSTADYYFKMQFTLPANATLYDTRFIKTTNATGLEFSTNGSTLINQFEKFILPYLTNRTFIADWLPTTINATNPSYRKFAGFYVKGTPANYFYGPLVLK